MKNKNLIILLIAIGLTAIVVIYTFRNDDAKNDVPFLQDTSIVIPTKSNGKPADKNRLLTEISIKVLQSLKDSNYQRFVTFFHPKQPVRFSPHGYIDTGNVRSFTASSFLDSLHNGNNMYWGDASGSGNPIQKTIPEYFRRYVYDVDFINAPQRDINHFLGFSTSINNLQKQFPGTDFIEYHFPGFDKKYEGLDWRSLRLVFDLYKGNYFLVGIVHDEWSP